MELRDFLVLLRRRAGAVIALTLIGLLVAAGVSAVQKPVYTATAESLVATPPATSAADLVSGGTFTQQVVTTYAQVATTAYVLDHVIAALHLHTTAGALAKQVSATSPANTAVVEITAKAGTAALAAGIANGVATELAARVPEVTPGTKRGTSAITIRLIQAATPPSAPTTPVWPLDLALGLLVGLAAGIGFIVLRENADTRVRDAADVAALTQRAVIGTIPFDPDARRGSAVAPPRTGRAEGYRALRTNLQFLGVGADRQAVVVTSATPGEGKTASVANTAAAIATAGRSVVVVDADLRSPRAAEAFLLDGAVGLTDVLIGAAGLDDALQRWGETGVTVLPAGAVPPNPSELLQSAAMRDVLGALRDRFDVVLVDTPPVLPFTDAAVLTAQVDGAILVAAEGRVRREALRQAVGALEQAGGRVLGLVVTMVRTSDRTAARYGQRPAARELARA